MSEEEDVINLEKKLKVEGHDFFLKVKFYTKNQVLISHCEDLNGKKVVWDSQHNLSNLGIEKTMIDVFKNVEHYITCKLIRYVEKMDNYPKTKKFLEENGWM